MGRALLFFTILSLSVGCQADTADRYADYCDAFEVMAEEGVELAQVELANCYILGLGREQDYEVAERLLLRASENGNERAKVSLASLVLLTIRDKSRYGSAVEALKETKENDKLGISEFDLAIAYRNGLGVDVNMDVSNEFFVEAAEKGHLLSNFVVFGQFEVGERVSSNGKDQDYWRASFFAALDAAGNLSVGDFKRRIVDDDLTTQFIFSRNQIQQIVAEL